MVLGKRKSEQLAAEIYPADRADSDTQEESVVQAQKNLIQADSPANIQEGAADKADHALQTMVLLNESLDIRTYIPEPKRKSRWKWSARTKAQRHTVTANHRRVGAVRSKKLQRLRSEFAERTFAHVCDTGGTRRCRMHGRRKVTIRYLLQVAARNLERIMRHMFGMGTPRGLRKAGDVISFLYLLAFAWWRVVQLDLRQLPSRAAVWIQNGPQATDKRQIN